VSEHVDVCDGIEVPLHRSLTAPMLIAGLPRAVALVLWTGTLAFAFGLRQIWMLPLGCLLHGVCAALTKVDPNFFDVFVLALRTPPRMEP
jgi:type IV secretory pathway TrbD component